MALPAWKGRPGTLAGILGALATLAAVPPEDASAWWNASWGVRRKITFDNSGQTQSLVDFPVLVRLDGTRIDYSLTQDAGQDLRFVDADDATPLSHEIELWNETGSSYVWVRVPQVDGASTSDHVYMYYGNAVAPDGQNPAGVWDASFKMVQHLNETTGAHMDSTSSGNDSSVVNVAVQGSAAGRIDGADSFVAASSHNVDVPDSATLDVAAAESLTVEAWIKTSTTGAYQHVLSKEDASGGYDLMVWNTNQARFDVYDSSNTASPMGVTVADGSWHYLVGRWDRATATADLLVDAAVAASVARPSLSTSAFAGGLPLVIGEEGDALRTYQFDGTIDEVRVSKAARSNDWIRAQFLSMTDAFAAYGAAEVPAPGEPVATRLTTSRQGGRITIETPDVRMVWDEAKGAGLRELYAKNEPNPTVSRGGTDSVYNLFATNVNSGAWLYEVAGAGSVELLEATPTRARLRQRRSYTPAIHLERDWTAYASPRLGIRETLTFDAPAQNLRGTTGIHAKGEASCPGNTFYCAGRSDGANRIWLVTDDSATYSDMLAVSYTDPFFSRASAAPLWDNSFENRSPDTPNTYLARVRETTSVSTLGSDTRAYLFHPHLPGLTSTGAEYQPYMNEYRNPDPLGVAAGSGWFDAGENTAGPADFFNEVEDAYVLNLDPALGLKFDIDGATTNRKKSFFKIRQWRSLLAPATAKLERIALVEDADYTADVKPVSRAHFARDLTWSSTLEDALAVSSPAVGTGGTVGAGVTFAAGRYGLGARFELDGDRLWLPTAGNFSSARGAIEFWYQPFYDYGGGPPSDDFGLFGYWIDSNNYFYAFHEPYGGAGSGSGAENGLTFAIKSGGMLFQTKVGSPPYVPAYWKAYEWVHLRFAWASGPSPRLEVYVNGTKLSAPPTGTYATPAPMDANLYVGDRERFNGFTNNAFGVIDEFRIYSSPDAPASLAQGGLTSDAQEFLADPGRNFGLDFAGLDGARRGRYLYVGSDSKFRGLNVALAAPGAGSVDLKWEFWNGTSWADLEAVGGFTDTTNSLARNGSLYWTADPPGWGLSSVNGGPDLYYVRAYLSSGSYSSPPVEGQIRTDILLFQHRGDITADAQTFELAPPVANVNYRSIGTAPDYTAGTVTVANGSATVTGVGTLWRNANRGRGDRITIPCPDPPACSGGVAHTVLSVDSESQLSLTTPYAGASAAGVSYSIARKFGSLAEWEDCIDGPPGGQGSGCEGVSTPSLIADDRNEVGIAYRDSAFAGGLEIDGSATDATHTITLTADHGNRHYGRLEQGAVVDNGGSGLNAVSVRDDFVTVEWLEIKNGGPGAHSLASGNLSSSNRQVFRNLLIHDGTGDGIRLQEATTVADVYNNIVYKVGRGIRVNQLLSGPGAVRILNNTLWSCATAGISAAKGSGQTYPTVVLRNNIAHGSPYGSNLDVPQPSGESSHNLASDGTGTTHSAIGGQNDVPLGPAPGAVNFESTAPGMENLHIKPGSLSAAENAGADLGDVFTEDVDLGLRSGTWDVGADEVGAGALADLWIAKDDGLASAVPGTDVAYTITVTNHGPSAVSSVRVVDTVPAAILNPVFTPLAGSYDPASGDWTGLSLSPGQGASMTLTGRINPSARGTLANTATVLPPAGLSDPSTANNTATDSDTLLPEADLSLDKRDGADPVIVGDTLTYTLDVLNQGPSDATGVVLTDALPPGLELLSTTPGAPVCSFDPARRTLTCDLGTIPAGGAASVAVDVLPVLIGSKTNSASVTRTEPDPDPADDGDTEQTTVDVPGDTVRFFTVTSTTENLLQWLNPNVGNFGSTAIRFSTTSFPTGPSDGSPVPGCTPSAGAGQKDSCTHGGLTPGQTYYYSAFVMLTPSGNSAGRFTKGRPFDTTGAVKWAFSTGATSLAPPGIGVGMVHAASNDNAVYAMDKATGAWPASPPPGWTPVALAGPSQGRPSTVPTTVLGVAQNVIFVSSQGGALPGAVHAINAESGQELWQTPLDPPAPAMVQAAPSGMFRAFGGNHDYILVGTRVSGADNRFYALNVNDGSAVSDDFWSFDGDDSMGGYGRIGIISNQASVDYAGRRLYFTSYARGAAPDDKTVWCVDLATDPPTVCWAAAHPNVTTSPSARGGRIYVGTYDSATGVAKVLALGTSDGLPAWEITINDDGPVKAFVMTDRTAPATALYFATTSRVWAYDDNDTFASVRPGWPAGGVALVGPSTPVLYPATRLYVGAGDGALHVLDTANGSDAAPPITLGDGLATVGSPTIDTRDLYLYVGSEAGVVYKVQRQ